MSKKLKRITIYPDPHVELRIHAKEQMIERLKLCYRYKTSCKGCEWKDVVFNGTRICLMKELKGWLKEHG